MTDQHPITPQKELTDEQLLKCFKIATPCYNMEGWRRELDGMRAAIAADRALAALAQPEPENADHASLDIEHKLQEARDEEFKACRIWLSRNVKMGGNISDAICIARRDERYWNNLRQ